MADNELRAENRNLRKPASGGDGRRPRNPDKARNRHTPPGKKRRKWPLRLLIWATTAAVWGFVAVAAMVAWFSLDLPDIEASLAAFRRPTVTVLAADGSVLATTGDLYDSAVALSDLPPILPQAVIATEDRRFYDHFGIDLIGLARAAVANLRAGRVVQGGSTITQQVAKNLFLTSERTLKRKVQELLVALWLERRFDKDQILAIYLNRVYLGSGAYGVAAAARRYFDRPVGRLGVYESAMLAGLLKAPSRYNPHNDPDLADQRARQVLENMVNAGVLTADQARAAPGHASDDAVHVPTKVAPYFVDWVIDQVPGYAGSGDRDLTVVTTLDPAIQRSAEQHMRTLLQGPGRNLAISQGAVIVLSTDGAVRALVGGADYAKSQFNRAVQARRQPGSAFKPMLFLAALEAGYTTQTPVDDAPIDIRGWRPANFDGRYEGTVTLGHALAYSLNTAAVRVAQRVGPERIIATARRLGITGKLPNDLGIALGTGEVTLVELTAAYAPFANGGFGVWPHAIAEIRDGGGAVVYRRSGSGPGRLVSAERVAAMNDMLAGVVREGTGRSAALDRPAAGKTGTSQDFRDAWFVGYTADLVAGVWLGNDDGQLMKNVTGGGAPARLWAAVMGDAHRGLPARYLPGYPPPVPVAQAPVTAPVAATPPAEEKGFWETLMDRLGGRR